MPAPTPATAADDTTILTNLDSLAHDVLPTVAVASGLMAAIWLACAVGTVCGVYLGSLTFVGARGLIRACARQVRRRRHAASSQLVTVHPDGVTTMIINLDHYRRRHRQRHSRSPSTERPDGSA
ncbi:hypothetical protein H0B56_17210 [Haloechinothrix sp. YIM 98757]|uniref:Uncharacterized protein n=1 Tax=Haloechinothrix aidingensis TaxID=2752311 RepID=A0A838ADL1_9PSEU|nr:hypothetical protein [Haloechinothrix aidingensis]MBA0127291.1 hypothetical protein [Haloechinothrix aidingensis]